MKPQVDPTDVPMDLDAERVARVRARIEKVNEAIRAALQKPSREAVAAIVDQARWAKLETDTALAFKRQAGTLRDAHWADLKFTSQDAAQKTLEEFASAPTKNANLVDMRNLRARIDGLLNVARGYEAAITAPSAHPSRS